MSRESKRELIDKLIHEVRASQTANDAFDEAASQALGINRTDARCLDILDNQGAMTAGRLAELSGLTTAAVTSVLDRLEKVGYARRLRDTEDRRRVNVELTPLLRERSERIWGPIGAEARAEIARLSVADLERLIEFFVGAREANERHVERVRKIKFD